jgi:hypothetical protein
MFEKCPTLHPARKLRAIFTSKAFEVFNLDVDGWMQLEIAGPAVQRGHLERLDLMEINPLPFAVCDINRAGLEA